MRIRHLTPHASCRGETAEPVRFHIGSVASWLSLAPHPQSRFEGWFIADGTTVPGPYRKLAEHIGYLVDGAIGEPIGLTLAQGAAAWEYADGTQLTFQTSDTPALSIRASRPVTLRLSLDTRSMYAMPEFGRNYTVRTTPDTTFIQYSDADGGTTLALRGVPEVSGGQWVEQLYPWDTARHSPPASRYTYVLELRDVTSVCIGAGATAEQALAAAHREPGAVPDFGVSITRSNDDVREQMVVARAAARATLDALLSTKGMTAGAPWFHQVWSRDELIAALGLEPREQREVLFRYLSLPLERGELPTFTGSGTTCADGVGWLALLVREHGTDHFSENERHELVAFFQKAIQGLDGRLSMDSLVISGHNATWMDTIGRVGCRLEIQAMYALVLELLSNLSGDEAASSRRAAHLIQIRRAFHKNGTLCDGSDDPTIRPNIFLAYLFAPDLLSETEWERTFSAALAVLRTPWGGLSSLDRRHPLFQPFSTGQDNQSYHQGDSWFFVNNLAAVALSRFGMQQFKPVVNELIASSTSEILWKHVAGHAGEIASATDGASWGCGVQAFSAGTYLFATRER